MIAIIVWSEIITFRKIAQHVVEIEYSISNNLNRVIGSRNLLGRNIFIRGTLWADTKDSIKTGVSFLSHFNGMNFTLNENRILSVRNENDAHSV